MSEDVSVEEVIRSNIPNFDDDCLDYLISVIEGMTMEERQNTDNLAENISPFLIETGELNEEDTELICRKVSVAFGSSGRSGAHVFTAMDDSPGLLQSAVRIIDNAEEAGLILNKSATYGKVVISNASGNIVGSNSAYDAKAMPTTQREARRMKRTAEQLRELLQREKAKRDEEQQKVIAERMRALQYQRDQIANSRVSKKHTESVFNRKGSSVTLDRFSLPHPSGSGELLSDVSLTLSCNRRYGLIGRNGSGKTTLMNSFARYQHKELRMLKVLLVDQHVEGDDDSAIQWCLRQDIERTMLMEEEKLLSQYLQYNPETATEPVS